VRHFVRFGDAADHLLFIDQQVSFDLAVDVLAEGHNWEAMRAALERVLSCEPFRLLDQHERLLTV